MKITPSEPFLDGSKRFEPEQEYDVERDDGVYYVRNGWARSPGYAPPGAAAVREPVNVRPDDSKQTSKTKED